MIKNTRRRLNILESLRTPMKTLQQ